MTITPLYAAVLALMFIALSMRTLRLRRKHKVAVGDGGKPELLRAMRVHANFAEYTPMTLLLIYMLESMSGPSFVIHALCICLVIGRISHAYGVSKLTENYRYRVFGMSMTFAALGLAAASLLIFRTLNGVT